MFLSRRFLDILLVMLSSPQLSSYPQIFSLIRDILLWFVKTESGREKRCAWPDLLLVLPTNNDCSLLVCPALVHWGCGVPNSVVNSLPSLVLCSCLSV